MPHKTVIYGAGGHAIVVADAMRCAGDFDIAGFLDDTGPGQCARPFAGSMVVGGRQQLASLIADGVTHGIVAIGNCAARMRLADALVSAGLKLATVIHPRAVVASGVSIGEGTALIAGAVINPGTVIGRNVIINTAATVDHECLIEDGAHVCPGVHLAGNVKVGSGAWIGIGATVIQKITIGRGATIGAGAVVLRDIPDGATAYGVPARIANIR